MTKLLQTLRNKLAFGELLTSKIVLILLTIQCVIYSSLGILILLDRPANTLISGEEVDLMGYFIGLTGIAFVFRSKE